MIDLILRTASVVVLAIELKSPPTEGVRLTQSSVASAAVVFARNDVTVRPVLARRIDELAVDDVAAHLQRRRRLSGVPDVGMRGPAVRLMNQQTGLEQALALRRIARVGQIRKSFYE